MLKKYKYLLLLTSLIILLPMVAGLCFWSRLPESVPTHFDGTGQADGWSSRGFAVFGLPLFVLVLHWICFAAVIADPKATNLSRKILHLTLWISPAVSLFAGLSIYGTVLGAPINTARTANLLLALMFIAIGNYLPKCAPNYTVGIKLPWTLHDENNWRRTHRFAGFLWMIGGVLLLPAALLPTMWVTFAVVLVLALLPVIYSLLLYIRTR